MIYYIANWSLKSLKHDLGPFTAAYLALDLLAVAGAVGAWCLYGASWKALITFVLVLYAVLISITDFRFQVIPDRIVLTGIAIGMIVAGFSDYVKLSDALAGGAVGLALLLLIAVLDERLLKKQSMGGGDIKLATMIGIFLDWQKLVLVIFLASILGLVFVFGRRPFTGASSKSNISFGPFLVYAALIAFIAGDKVIQVYLSWFGLR